MHRKDRTRSTIRARGQHILCSEETARKLVEAAKIKNTDTVLEIGTGTGSITRLLSQRSGKVISFEIDPIFYASSLKTLSSNNNLQIEFGDAFEQRQIQFDVCVTSLPYSQSLRFIKWLALRSGSFKRCVAIVQKEFSDKISARTGEDSYRSVSVIAQISFDLERLFPVDRDQFSPRPRVSSEAILILPRKDVSQPFFDELKIRLLNKLFSFRGRLLSAAMKSMTIRHEFLPDILRTRIENLNPNQFAALIQTMERNSL